ncbi:MULTISPECIES: 3-oxoacyl-[acyl-carrier-protein] reductase [unclassified Oceanispirochaeta]|uniref:3-oxoacyl-[acyl-carrier-protein] reductase n=1 Tax=unclassified Oceanispirochaeta TaxID=2635722 RepID=UPI000E08F5B3|nr:MULTISPECIES: 3-oxoacyl-[acyl-carrier-protein] reductase [unclassified Oceanispirochaeta]MBF9017811.1 3-oxoacyl-[acyl-carrier-protein] reductase [Oceanispirochaeta sp. M2]NPD74271.1 3-oxoacyl-[acyl-carrier-protein] reductase [Oceanispirochaeta sp. M1]RDG29861.1 3-oxoacyl-[acyl-carrier-protein] reductase [Oceanispirochaeta sp. M1]
MKGKKVLVTGGSRGIGKEIVKIFLEEGADVHFISTSPSPHIEEMETLATANKASVTWHQGNVADEAQMIAIVEPLAKEGLDVVVNNAGITRDGLIFRMSLEQWEQVMQVNLTSAFIISRIAASQMIRKRTGSIINMSSVVGITGNGGQCNYSASKAGMIGLTKSLAKEVSSRGVRVNAVAPGFIDTDMTKDLGDKIMDELKKQIPLGHTGSGRDIAEAVLFLASDRASYITGQVLNVDGGMVM